MSRALDDARAARVAAGRAGDATEFYRARALEEGLLRNLRTWNPRLHPRDRQGRFITAISRLKQGDSLNLGGVRVRRTGTRTFEVEGGQGRGSRRRVLGAKWAAAEAAERHDADETVRKLEAMNVGEVARVLSPEAQEQGRRGVWVRKQPVKPGGRRDPGGEPLAVYEVGTHEGSVTRHGSAREAGLVARKRGWEAGVIDSADEGSDKVRRRRDREVRKQLTKVHKVRRRMEGEERVESAGRAALDVTGVDDLPFEVINWLVGHGHKPHFWEFVAGEPETPGTIAGAVEVVKEGVRDLVGKGADAVDVLATAGANAPQAAAGLASNAGVEAVAAAMPGVAPVAEQLLRLVAAHDRAAAARQEAARAGDSTAFTRARAREEALARELEEALASTRWKPDLHPRDRLGKFIEALRRLGRGDPVERKARKVAALPEKMTKRQRRVERVERLAQPGAMSDIGPAFSGPETALEVLTQVGQRLGLIQVENPEYWEVGRSWKDFLTGKGPGTLPTAAKTVAQFVDAVVAAVGHAGPQAGKALAASPAVVKGLTAILPAFEVIPELLRLIAAYDESGEARRRAYRLGDSTAFARARARELAVARELEEALSVVKWDPAKHPRGRAGQFVEVLGKLEGLGLRPAGGPSTFGRKPREWQVPPRRPLVRHLANAPSPAGERKLREIADAGGSKVYKYTRFYTAREGGVAGQPSPTIDALAKRGLVKVEPVDARHYRASLSDRHDLETRVSEPYFDKRANRWTVTRKAGRGVEHERFHTEAQAREAVRKRQGELEARRDLANAPRDNGGELEAGVTPQRRRSKDLDRYRQQPRFREYEQDVDRIAAEEGVTVDRTRADGEWEGEPETADKLIIRGGTREARRRVPMRLGKKYKQDAVILWERDDTGPDVMWRIKGVESREHMAELARRMGSPGGRWLPGERVAEIADPGGALADRVRQVAREQGLGLGYDRGHVEFPGKPWPADLAESGRAGGRAGRGGDPSRAAVRPGRAGGLRADPGSGRGARAGVDSGAGRGQASPDTQGSGAAPLDLLIREGVLSERDVEPSGSVRDRAAATARVLVGVLAWPIVEAAAEAGVSLEAEWAPVLRAERTGRALYGASEARRARALVLRVADGAAV